jgi:hypothetical protein
VSSSGSVGSVEAPSLDELRQGLAEAVKAEDYASATRIRDRIAELEQTDPVVQTERQLEQAIAEERFGEAARLRDRLRELQPPPPPPPAPSDPISTTTSEAVTDGVRVSCRSFYVPAESAPRRGSFFFA